MVIYICALVENESSREQFQTKKKNTNQEK